jgi:hypothetical protein
MLYKAPAIFAGAFLLYFLNKKSSLFNGFYFLSKNNLHEKNNDSLPGGMHRHELQ